MPSLNYIDKPEDLITSHEDVRQGFLEQAIEKVDRSEPFIKRAREFHEALVGVETVEEILALEEFEEEIAASVGLSQKALNNITEDERKETINVALQEALENDYFKESLVYRYLLTRGDSVGGSIRNWIGSLAGEKLTQALIVELEKHNQDPVIDKTDSGKTRSIQWDERWIVFDKNSPIINKNIDVLLFDVSKIEGVPAEMWEEISGDPPLYLAAGELKGGIDPAGADEHWKTANSALGRIRRSFKDEKNKPQLFFAGAAIEQSMAEEIFEQIQEGKLSYAANINSQEQLDDLVAWLTTL